MELKDYIRNVPNFPQAGIQFKDITPLLKAPDAFQQVVDRVAQYCTAIAIDAIVGIEARGFLIAAPLAYHLKKPLIPVRKQGKLPFRTTSITYALEYGNDTIEIHQDAIAEGQKVLIVDDLLATGGTMAATTRLVGATGAHVAALVVLIELIGLGGRDALEGYDVHSLIQLSA
ncbi:adenine phosphoribosyltransferase [Chloroflexota bacterium]